MTDEQGDWLTLPDAPPPRPIPDLGRRQVAGFRVSRVFDGVAPDGTVTPWGRLDDVAARVRVLGYLTSGTVVVASTVRGRDLVDPRRHFAVSAGYRTDGHWIWPEAVAYYLEQHGIAPEPDFLEHLLAADDAPTVSADVVGAAREAAHDYLADRDEREAEWLRQNDRLARADETRFRTEVRERLLDLGWFPGRNVQAAVDAWLARHTPFYGDITPDDLAPYAIVPAALAVMYEFGGLRSLRSAPGRTQATIPFTIYPASGDEELDQWLGRIRELGEDLDVRLCQVGDVERGQGALAVDEHGHVYVAGPVNFHVGTTVEEAVTRLLDGGPGIERV